MEVDRFGVDRRLRDDEEEDACWDGDTSGDVGTKSTSSSVRLRRREELWLEAGLLTGLLVKLNASKLVREKFKLDWDSIILEK